MEKGKSVSLIKFFFVIIGVLASIMVFMYSLPLLSQEENTIQLLGGICKIFMTGESYVKISDTEYIVRENEVDKKRLLVVLQQQQLTFIEQMGAGLFFKDKDNNRYTATSWMYTRFYEIWEFDKVVK